MRKGYPFYEPGVFPLTLCEPMHQLFTLEVGFKTDKEKTQRHKLTNTKLRKFYLEI
jgi:hypothetical protein